MGGGGCGGGAGTQYRTENEGTSDGRKVVMGDERKDCVCRKRIQ